jgi:hypothetical protein
MSFYLRSKPSCLCGNEDSRNGYVFDGELSERAHPFSLRPPLALSSGKFCMTNVFRSAIVFMFSIALYLFAMYSF